MIKYNKKQLEALTNWDGLLSKKPFRNIYEERHYYSRYLAKRLWRYLRQQDWKRLAVIIDDLKIPPKTKEATKFLLKHRLKK